MSGNVDSEMTNRINECNVQNETTSEELRIDSLWVMEQKQLHCFVHAKTVVCHPSGKWPTVMN